MNIPSAQLRERSVFPLTGGVETLVRLEGGQAANAHWAVVVPAGQREAVIEALKKGETPTVNAGITCVKNEGGIAFYFLGLCRFVRKTAEKVLQWNAPIALEEPETAFDFSGNGGRTLAGQPVEGSFVIKGVIFRKDGKEVYRANLTNFHKEGGRFCEEGLSATISSKGLVGGLVYLLSDNANRVFGHVAVFDVGFTPEFPYSHGFVVMEALSDAPNLFDQVKALREESSRLREENSRLREKLEAGGK